jgi:hypothetical protein
MDYTKYTLGELLTHTNETIKRNAMSILKTLQKENKPCHHDNTVIVNGLTYCNDCEIYPYIMN